jgi:cobalt-zinc-cadmium efflux system membrane fusion protein
MRYLTPLMTMLAGCMTWTCVHAEAVGCLVEPDRVADVGSQSVGVLERLMVERGDVVSAGQVVARLSAQVERASASVAEARSQAEAEVRQAVAAHDLARRKFERTRDLVKQDFVSDQALDQAEAESRVAEQRVMQAREAQKVSLREYRLSSAQLGQRDVRSPFEGIVVERYRTEGERIEREPVVRVARIDPLRIEAIVPASQFGTVLAGQMATIKTDLVNFSAMTAKVVLVDRVIDPASNSFRVRLTLPNPDRKIPPGMRCKVDFALAAAPAPAKGASTPVPSKVDRPIGESPALSKAANQKRPNNVPMPAPVTVPTPADARVAKTPMVGVLPGVLPSVHLVSARMAPERMLVKQYIASREPKLVMSRQMAMPRQSSLDDDRPMFSLR